MSPQLQISHEESILHIHLNKAEKRNALDDAMVEAIADEVDLAGRDEDVRSILLTAEGQHFCSGFDIVSRNATAANEGSTDASRKPRAGSIQRRLPAEAHRLIQVVWTSQVPIVVAARGWVAGIGLHLAAASDFLIVAEDAHVWEPFSERGFTPDSGGSWLLPRLIGVARARRLLLLGEAIDGRTAAEWGLAHAAVPANEVDRTAKALAERLAAGPTVTLGLTKWLLATTSEHTLEQHLRDEAFAMEVSSRSEDFREGLKAFIEKRPPKFSGR